MGQGYLDHAAHSVQVQLAWFRETDHEWLLILAVETEQRRVETPPGTFLTIPDERGAEQDLAMQLLLMLSEMSGPTAV